MVLGEKSSITTKYRPFGIGFPLTYVSIIFRLSAANTLDQWLDTQVTDLAIKHAILLLIQGVRDPSLPSLRDVPGRLCRAFCSQQCIGYQGLLEGLLSCQWAPLQEEYLQLRGRQLSHSVGFLSLAPADLDGVPDVRTSEPDATFGG
ncbi:unnamed protein product [Cylindrotheca closterium]|uniref:Uncharacterized protein n=1 Tax=Cylindrotheca closterium TaxID=2856 RepID=A0AAD2FGL6_9STRA|nr:unnamed protein product [Cylindrotheca closterium]